MSAGLSILKFRCATANRFAGAVLTVVAAFGTGGCASHPASVTQLRATNPLPEVRRVAIAPFINLSTEPDFNTQTDQVSAGLYSDRRFAKAYFAELQKVPGFEVIPVGVVEQAIAEGRMPMNGPDDFIAVAEAIGADAICVGAVTDSDPYHPRLALQVNWYAVDVHRPPIPTLPHERARAEELYLPSKKALHDRRGKSGRTGARRHGKRGHKGGDHGSRDDGGRNNSDAPCDDACVRAQSPSPVVESLPAPPDFEEAISLPPPADFPPTSGPPMLLEIEALAGDLRAAELEAMKIELRREPLYSYTRLFDGRESRLTARLRDYVELSGNLRSGGWEAYLQRSDDFIRFCCYVMVNDMLILHGGESGRTTTYKTRRNEL